MLWFKYVLRRCTQNEEFILADQHAKYVINTYNIMTSSWDYIRESSKPRPLALIVENRPGEENIAHCTAIFTHI